MHVRVESSLRVESIVCVESSVPSVYEVISEPVSCSIAGSNCSMRWDA